MARVRVSLTIKPSGLTTPTSRAVGAVQSELDSGGCGCGIFVSATCLLLRVIFQGRQRRDTAAAGEEQHGRCTAGYFMWAGETAET